MHALAWQISVTKSYNYYMYKRKHTYTYVEREREIADGNKRAGGSWGM